MTLSHELGHLVCGHVGDLSTYRTCRGRCEVEAESVAYVVAVSVGLDAAGYPFAYVAYVASWTGGEPALVRQAAETVTTAGRTILGRARPHQHPHSRRVTSVATSASDPPRGLVPAGPPAYLFTLAARKTNDDASRDHPARARAGLPSLRRGFPAPLPPSKGRRRFKRRQQPWTDQAVRRKSWTGRLRHHIGRQQLHGQHVAARQASQK